MQQNYQSTKLPTVGASSAIGGASAWSNPSRITADDGSSASWGAFLGGQQSLITGSSFAFQQLPASAVIDGVQVYVDGSQTGCFGDVTISPSGTTGKSIGSFGSYGGPTDLWGASSISIAAIAALSVGVSANDVSGGDGIASIDCIKVTVFWHIEVTSIPSDVPTRLVHKVYSSGGKYLGKLPAASQIAFSQEINSAGSSAQITCGVSVDPVVSTEAITDQAGDPLLTDSSLDILATESEQFIATGDSDIEVIFKNGNRIKSWLYNQWYPNGKLVFSGQINKISYKSGGGQGKVALLVYSDGIDLDNFIARGYPFAYTLDQSFASWDTVLASTVDERSGWNVYGQSFKTGAGVTNLGAIDLLLRGSADVTITVYDAVNGNTIGSVTQTVSGVDQPTAVRFSFAQLITVTAATNYFFAVWVGAGQSIDIYWNSTGGYADGITYNSNYGGGSGGGSFLVSTGDMWFKTYSGLPTTTTTYSTQDPITGMAHGILLDYNQRGGLITERDFTAAGVSLTNLFNSATIFGAIKKCVELSPSGYYSYVDLGTAEIDILPTSTTPDFTVVLGKDINDIEIVLSIENVKNQLLLSGGETAGVNLFRQYQDSSSAARYGTRLAQQSDNRITLAATADAIGNSFIDENAEETQETPLTILNSKFDITLLTPGKTIGFRNGGTLIDSMLLRIARRDFTPEKANLTLGRLPLATTSEIEKIRRDLLLEQTISNPSAPS
jgi:hypothetical protein